MVPSVCSLFPVSNVYEMTGNRGGGGHSRAYQVSTPAFALAAFKIAVGGAGATLAFFQAVPVHGNTHATARFAPLETRFQKYFVQPFGLGLLFDQTAPRHHHRPDGRGYLLAFNHAGGFSQVFE